MAALTIFRAALPLVVLGSLNLDCSNNPGANLLVDGKASFNSHFEGYAQRERHSAFEFLRITRAIHFYRHFRPVHVCNRIIALEHIVLEGTSTRMIVNALGMLNPEFRLWR